MIEACSASISVYSSQFFPFDFVSEICSRRSFDDPMGKRFRVPLVLYQLVEFPSYWNLVQRKELRQSLRLTQLLQELIDAADAP